MLDLRERHIIILSLGKALKNRLLLLLLSVLSVSACATLGPDWEDPTVTVTSFQAVPSDGMAPAFDVGLRILNPNASDLELEGIVYTISIEGKELIKGVGKDFPVIEGYSQEDIQISASVQLIAGLRLVSDLMKNQGDSLAYEFKAKLDLKGIYPTIYVTETGTFDMGAKSM